MYANITVDRLHYVHVCVHCFLCKNKTPMGQCAFLHLDGNLTFADTPVIMMILKLVVVVDSDNIKYGQIANEAM